MTEKAKNPASDALDQGLKNYEQALRTGLKLQEEAGKYWTRMLNQAASPQDLPKQFISFANEMIPAAQKSMQNCIELIEQNSRTSATLIKQGLEAAQATSCADGQSKVVEFCESSLGALRANAQAILDINNKAIDSWTAFIKKATQAHTPRAEKA